MTKDINKPLTPKELKDLQKKQPKSSPYEPYKSPFPKAKASPRNKKTNEVNTYG